VDNAITYPENVFLEPVMASLASKNIFLMAGELLQ